MVGVHRIGFVVSLGIYHRRHILRGFMWIFFWLAVCTPKVADPTIVFDIDNILGLKTDVR